MNKMEHIPTSGSWWQRRLTPMQVIARLIFAGVVAAGMVTAYELQKPGHGFLEKAEAEGFGIRASSAAPFSIDQTTFSLIPKDQIHAGGPPKDGIPALTAPKTVPAGSAGLQPEDRVIGVSLEGEARAYPLRILNWHEVVNDTLGGRDIAVTYCPLCDSALVFDRDIGGEVREFGVSGLLYNSNVLMYDRQGGDETKESLWSQMMLKAVVGPAAREGLKLELVPAQLTTWESWSTRHPETTSLSFDTGYSRNYDGNPYAGYFASPDLMFPVVPVSPASDADSLPAKEPTIIVFHNGRLKGYPVSRLRSALKKTDSNVTDSFAGKEFVFTPVDSDKKTFEVHDSEGNPVPTAFSFWFEFRAAHPAAEVFGGTKETSAAKDASVDSFEVLVLKSSKPVLVDFWAEWCAICKVMDPILVSLAEERGDSFALVRVDVDKEEELAEKYGVQGLPTLVLFKGGEEIARRAGFVDRAGLEEFLESGGASP